MANYVLVYKGGRQSGGNPEAAMAAWGQWFGKLGSAVVEGGNPFGPSKVVGGGNATDGASSNLTGFSILKADSLDAAAALAKDCPVVANGGTVEVYETIKM
jgi:hypothetical protein